MSRIAFVVWWVMEHACKWTGHNAFLCWNEPRWVNRLWFWAYTHDDSEPAA